MFLPLHVFDAIKHLVLVHSGREASAVSESMEIGGRVWRVWECDHSAWATNVAKRGYDSRALALNRRNGWSCKSKRRMVWYNRALAIIVGTRVDCA